MCCRLVTCCLLLTAVVKIQASFNILAIGDWGADPLFKSSADDDEDEGENPTPYGVDDQRRVADRMDQWVGENGGDIVLALADNFYPDGLESMEDPRFDLSWRYMYNGSNIGDLHWYASLGNHDHFLENAYYQVNMSNYEPRWHLPSFWFDEYFEKDGVTVHVVALDTELLNFNWFNDTAGLSREDQLRWINDTLTNAREVDWTLVYGHHPLRSCGRYGPRGNVLINIGLQDLLWDNDVDIYLDGHDHNLQHIAPNDTMGMEYIISGGGGRGRYELRPFFCEDVHEDGFTSHLFAERYGFATLEITADEIVGSFYGDVLIDGNLELLHTFTRTKAQQKRHHKK